MQCFSEELIGHVTHLMAAVGRSTMGMKGIDDARRGLLDLQRDN